MSLVELGRFSRNEAHILVGRLESEGLHAVAFDNDLSVGDGSGLLVPVRVMVGEDDLGTARRIVAAAA